MREFGTFLAMSEPITAKILHLFYRYLLPAALLVFIALARRRRTSPDTAHALSETVLQAAISDLNIISSLLPSIPSIPTTPLPQLLRVSAITYVPYVILTYFVPLRVLVGLFGTFVLTYRASWATLLRRNLWRSAWTRWAMYRLWSYLSGTPFPAELPAVSLHAQQADDSHTTARIHFLFTVYENQRWWMGLDWTAALLPNERPSWCSVGFAPVPPPSVFSLPEPSVTFLDDSHGGRIKRTAMWSWEEQEWKVIVHREGDASAAREVRSLPIPREDGTAASRLRKLMDASAPAGSNANASDKSDGSGSKDQPEATKKEELEGEEEVTDADGWVFGDNKWESKSSKGGMGKVIMLFIVL
jgi:hypothetical protein